MNAVYESVNEFISEAEQLDDIIMLCVSYFGKDETAKEDQFKLRLPAKTENLDTVLAFVNQKLAEHNCSMQAEMEINIAVEEIFVNIAHYAYTPEEGDATICMSFDGSEVSITFIDEGVPYNPLEKDDPDITLSAEERVIGGLGIFMVKMSMDQMEYKYEDNKNILMIRKSIAEMP